MEKTSKNQFIEPAEILSLVGYQENSIVSRQILKEKSGSITIFAFDAGEGLSEHTAPFEAFVLVLDGSAIITIDKKDFQVTKSEVIILPANIPHAVKAEEKFKMLLVMLKTPTTE